MQALVYYFLKDHLKTEKEDNSLLIQYGAMHDAQSIYRELKRHLRSSTAAQVPRHKFLLYIQQLNSQDSAGVVLCMDLSCIGKAGREVREA